MNDRELLARHGITPKKSLGQNFLHDPGILQKIVSLAELTPETTVLEIGPGTGNLTRLLAGAAARVIAVELDDRLMPVLQETLAGQTNVTLVHADILTLEVAALLDAPYTLVANVPYYITSAILRHVFDQHPRPRRLVLTMQREVAERLVATPGTMSLLAVSVQFYGRPQVAMRIKAGAFWPRPDVDSAVVRIDTYDTPPVNVPDEALFFRVVRAGFGQKRKQLRNALSSGLHIDKTTTEAVLQRAGVAPTRRAESLSLGEWAALTRALDALGSGP